MRKIAVFVPLVLLLLLAGPPAAAADIVPPFIGTWVVTQGSMLPDGTAIPFEVFSVPELIHVDLNYEIRGASGLFHANSLGTVWPVVEGRTVVVPVNASQGIGDWGYRNDGAVVVFFYHALLYGADGKPVGLMYVTRTFGEPEETPEPPDGPVLLDTPPAPVTSAPDEWTGMAIVKFYDLKGQPLYLPMVEGAPPVSAIGGPFRAVRAPM